MTPKQAADQARKSNETNKQRAMGAYQDAFDQRRFEVAMALLSPDAADPEDLSPELRRIWAMPSPKAKMAALTDYVRGKGAVYMASAHRRFTAKGAITPVVQTMAETQALLERGSFTPERRAEAERILSLIGASPEIRAQVLGLPEARTTEPAPTAKVIELPRGKGVRESLLANGFPVALVDQAIADHQNNGGNDAA